MTIDELQTMIDDYMLVLEPPYNKSKRLLLKNQARVARLLLDRLTANQGKVRQYNPEKLEGMIRDFKEFRGIIDAGESYSDVEAANACVLEKNIIWIAQELMEMMKEEKSVPNMTGCLAIYAKGIPEKPFSAVREEVCQKMAKDRVIKDSRREEDLSELENEVDK
ncbi:hypothetical protein [Oryzomonas rubra]|uniref:Uncharacterized protein n=1 Tax=Oryzomonas rubra TaxID=2509454 RepID=A0A5A9XNS9_9BACT|nr:hypothetical protein [Oryzomonas rubra]KAA0894243.1 hypothetical protein ET418_04620 [Oryzomonas rubra]